LAGAGSITPSASLASARSAALTLAAWEWFKLRTGDRLTGGLRIARYGFAHRSRYVFHDPDVGIVENRDGFRPAMAGQQRADALIDDPLGRLNAGPACGVTEGIGFGFESAAFRVNQREIGTTAKPWLYGGIPLGSRRRDRNFHRMCLLESALRREIISRVLDGSMGRRRAGRRLRFGAGR
jgi:hypothetical protein